MKGRLDLMVEEVEYCSKEAAYLVMIILAMKGRRMVDDTEWKEGEI